MSSQGTAIVSTLPVAVVYTACTYRLYSMYLQIIQDVLTVYTGRGCDITANCTARFNREPTHLTIEMEYV